MNHTQVNVIDSLATCVIVYCIIEEITVSYCGLLLVFVQLYYCVYSMLYWWFHMLSVCKCLVAGLSTKLLV